VVSPIVLRSETGTSPVRHHKDISSNSLRLLIYYLTSSDYQKQHFFVVFFTIFVDIFGVVITISNRMADRREQLAEKRRRIKCRIRKVEELPST
jgi:hypothetical protein